MKEDDLLRILDAAAEPDPGRILDALIQASGAERGYLVMRDGVPVRQDMSSDEVKISRTLIARALAESRPIVASDTDLVTIDSVMAQQVRSVLVLPLKVSGCAIYLDHKRKNDVFEFPDRLARYTAALDKALAHRHHGYGELLGRSAVMVDLYQKLDRVAEAPYPVLIVGESGSGKELAARAIHRRGPYVATSCAVFPEQLIASELFGHVKGAFTGAERDRDGLFVQADGGILFLDDVDHLPLAAQDSLLRILETGELRRVGSAKSEKVNVRVITATNKNLEGSEDFRHDLYYRLNVLRIDLPPLRDRGEDIPLIAERQLDLISKQLGRGPIRLSPEALAVLIRWTWPGNVRELINCLERAAVMSGRQLLEPSDFPDYIVHPKSAPASGVVSIDDHVKEMLRKWGDQLELQEIADKLGISRKTLWEKKKKWGL